MQDNHSQFEHETYAKVTRRILPLLFLCYVASYLDRVNVGFAKLQMLSDLNFSETIYGFGAGIFFIGYFLFEVPSNLLLYRLGARIWIARIMVTWGLISGAMVFVQTPTQFYVMRFLLGLAEAGFFPGIILHLTYWYPAQRRGRITALFMTAVAVSGVIGGPLSGWIMQSMPGVWGLAGWKWMFVIEAVPSIVLGIVVLFYLQDKISDADWLSAEQKELLHRNIQSDNVNKREFTLLSVVKMPRLWQMAMIYFSFIVGLYGIGFWLPSILKATGISSPLHIGLLTALPYAAASIAMVWIGHSADQRRERRWHIIIPALFSSVGLVLTTLYGHNTLLAMMALTLATIGILTALPLFWSMPTALLTGGAAAAGIAMINSFGNLAGFASPFLVGWLKDTTGTTDAGMYLMAASMVMGAVLTFLVPAKLVNK